VTPAATTHRTDGISRPHGLAGNELSALAKYIVKHDLASRLAAKQQNVQLYTIGFGGRTRGRCGQQMAAKGRTAGAGGQLLPPAILTGLKTALTKPAGTATS